MARSAAPRKAYRPKPVHLNSLSHAIDCVALLTPAQRRSLVNPVQRALAGLRDGRGQWPAWRDMADALNVSERLALAGIASDRVAEFTAAQAALAALHARVHAGGTWTMYPAELTALAVAAELHEVQLQVASQGEVAAAIRAVKQRVAQALAGNAPAGAIVCHGLLSDRKTTTTHGVAL